MITGVKLIAEERQRQIEVEGFDEEHDAKICQNGVLAAAACYYAWPNINNINQGLLFPIEWGMVWAKRENKSRLQQLVVAGALIAAEIDRLLKPGAR
jgi:hypothetical protein